MDGDPSVQFALHCLKHHPLQEPPDKEYVILNEVHPLRRAYSAIFKSTITDKSIVFIILRGAILEDPTCPGCYLHMMGDNIPQYARVVLKHLDIELFEKRVSGVDGVPCWNM